MLVKHFLDVLKPVCPPNMPYLVLCTEIPKNEAGHVERMTITIYETRERERKRKTSSLLIWFQTFKDSPSQPATQVAFTKSSQPLSKKERPLHRQFYQGMFARVSVIHCSLKEIEQVLNGREWWKQWKRKPSSNLMNGPAIVRSQEEDQGPHAWIWCMMYDVCMDVCM